MDFKLSGLLCWFRMIGYFLPVSLYIMCVTLYAFAFKFILLIPVLPNLRFRCPIGLLLTSALRPAKPYRYFATIGLLLTSWPRNVLKLGASVKIFYFLSIQGDFEPFQCQWADLSSIDRIKTSYRAIEGDYSQLPELNNLSFFCPIGWFLDNLPHKKAQN